MIPDTIFALSSGVGRAAIAIVRLSGRSVRFVLETMAGGAPKPRFAALRRICRSGDGAVLDQGLVLFFPGPRSETGEDMAELQLHGGRAVVASVLAALSALPGLRPAEPGEFARRALANGKMDLLDIESLADLIDAETEAQRKQAVEGAGSLLRGKVEAWREILLDIRADLEAGIDFSDEGDVQQYFDSTSERLIRTLLGEIRQALSHADRGERIREGFRVALLGPPNAGKSSLLNALAGREVAIVSDVPGTTRDRLEVALDLGGYPVLVSDTAGLQETADAVELEGIRRSHGAAREADLVLWLSPSDSPAAVPEALKGGAALRVVSTKSDLKPAEGRTGPPAISVLTGAGLEDLLGAIEAAARGSDAAGEPALLTRARHRSAMQAAAGALHRALAVPEGSAEICAEEVRLAERALAQLLGRIGVEDVLGAIFSRFCIGK